MPFDNDIDRWVEACKHVVDVEVMKSCRVHGDDHVNLCLYISVIMHVFVPHVEEDAVYESRPTRRQRL